MTKQSLSRQKDRSRTTQSQNKHTQQARETSDTEDEEEVPVATLITPDENVPDDDVIAEEVVIAGDKLV